MANEPKELKMELLPPDNSTKPPLPPFKAALGPTHDGMFRLGVATDHEGRVHIHFGKNIDSLIMPPEQAIGLAKLIAQHAGAKKINIE